MPGGQLIIHIETKHKVRRPLERCGDIHVWISPNQRDAFVHIAESLDMIEPISYKEIGEKMGVAIGTVQHYLDRLKAMGLIETGYNRKRSIRLTELGKVAWEQVKARRK